MGKIALLADVLGYVEENLGNPIRTSDIAATCYCSRSTLEKMFRSINKIGIHDYILRRRMTLAAKWMLEAPEQTLLDIALQVGYGSHEAFSRAFYQVWHCKPSEYRKEKRYYELFPRILCPLEIGDEYMDTRRHVDISELYDLFRERSECFFICCDIKNLTEINELSRKAGDQAILETLNRMYAVSGKEDVVFRIGGDEFTILTDSTDSAYAAQLAGKLSGRNGEAFSFEGKQIPLNLHISTTKLEHTERYSELFVGLHHTIQEQKE